MKYEVFCAAYVAAENVKAVIDEFRNEDDVQIVAETGINSEYWLMQKIAGQTKYVMTWCWDEGERKHDDVEFDYLEDVVVWLFEQYTDGNVTEFWIESM